MDKIIILFKNNLLKEALTSYLYTKVKDLFQIESHLNPNIYYKIILFDPPSLKEHSPDDFSTSYKILLDTGLLEQELLFLIMYYRLAGVFEEDTPPHLIVKCFEVVSKGGLMDFQKINPKVIY